MSLSATLRRVIELATAIRTYWDTELPKRHPNYPIIKAGAAPDPRPPEESELRKLLGSLPAEEVYTILAVMYLGRGDFSARGFAHERLELTKTFESPERAIRQMMAKGPLADYLTDGLAELAANGIDVDSLQLAAT